MYRQLIWYRLQMCNLLLSFISYLSLGVHLRGHLLRNTKGIKWCLFCEFDFQLNNFWWLRGKTCCIFQVSDHVQCIWMKLIAPFLVLLGADIFFRSFVIRFNLLLTVTFVLCSMKKIQGLIDCYFWFAIFYFWFFSFPHFRYNY